MDYEEYIEHYGVKGMKWGQRGAGERTSTFSGSARRSPQPKPSVISGKAPTKPSAKPKKSPPPPAAKKPKAEFGSRSSVKAQKIAAYRKDHPEPAKDHRKMKIAAGVVGVAYVGAAAAFLSTPKGRQFMNLSMETVKAVGEAGVARVQNNRSEIFNPHRFTGEAIDAVVRGTKDGVNRGLATR